MPNIQKGVAKKLAISVEHRLQACNVFRKYDEIDVYHFSDGKVARFFKNDADDVLSPLEIEL